MSDKPLPICRNFTASGVLRGCFAGLIAYIDCGPGCPMYCEDNPELRSEEDNKYWSSATLSATIEAVKAFGE